MHKLFSLIIVATGGIDNNKAAQGGMKYHSAPILLLTLLCLPPAASVQK